MSIKKFNDFRISSELKGIIMREFIEPNYKETVKENLELIKYFRRFSLAFESVSKLLVGMGSVISFSSGLYNNRLLSFVSGTVSVVSLVFLQYSTYASKESKKHISELNQLLKQLNIEPLSEHGSDNVSMACTPISIRIPDLNENNTGNVLDRTHTI